MLKLMYITNRPDVAKIAEKEGVERIFVDMEYIGKDLRQGGMNTVQNSHTIEDVKSIRKVLSKSDLMVRCNPIHDAFENTQSSKEEIDQVIQNGADIIMLPYFKTIDEVKRFVSYVGGRAKTLLLLETPEAVEIIDEIIDLKGVDEIFIGLNDLSLGYGKKFMFELLADGTVEMLCNKFKTKGMPYGFGGIASLGKGMLPSEHVIAEHYRLGSTCAILSRSFCNINNYETIDGVEEVFDKELKKIRQYEQLCQNNGVDFEENRHEVVTRVKKIVEQIK